jgi:hypothetical protein
MKRSLEVDDPAQEANDEALLTLARATTKRLMGGNDASHDFSHAFRVAATARALAQAESKLAAAAAAGERELTPVDDLVVALAATLHDVADHKVWWWCASRRRFVAGWAIIFIIHCSSLTHEQQCWGLSVAVYCSSLTHEH